MNAKKAKKLRQLVRHLIEKSNGDTQTEYDDQVVKRFAPVVTTEEGEGLEEQVRILRTLKPSCQRAVYKQMKKNS